MYFASLQECTFNRIAFYDDTTKSYVPLPTSKMTLAPSSPTAAARTPGTPGTKAPLDHTFDVPSEMVAVAGDVPSVGTVTAAVAPTGTVVVMVYEKPQSPSRATARCFTVFKHGSPPKASLDAVSVHEDLPTHAAMTTERDVAALHEGFTARPVEHVPVGVPKEANATPEKVDLRHVMFSTAFSGAVAHTDPTAGFAGVAQPDATAPIAESIDADADDSCARSAGELGGVMDRRCQLREPFARPRPASVE